MVPALLARGVDDLRRHLGAVAAQVLMQPLMLLLVFGVVLPRLGYTPVGYDAVLLPGLVALNAFFAAVQNASFPLAVMPPLLFTGSAQFPFPQLSVVPWFAAVCALNPMTYVSEGLRAALTPAVPHLPLPLCAGVLVGVTTILGAAAVVTFRRRARL